ncbi:hypothetical protein, partial [Klebsiella pneumoniae]|uniref:hypothetical protein n=1 Tax=Klebsiella pneumoniae TaxID=573 RepID=UPI00132FAB88
ESSERNHKSYIAALKEQLQSSCLQWQQERTSLLAKAEKDRATHVSQLESDRLQWQQEKMSLLAETENLRARYESQLNKEKQENSTLVEALKEAEGQLQSQRNIWQEERASLLQARENLNETLQAMEQTESVMRSRIEELEEKIAKKKRQKWYRIFRTRTTSGSV